MSETAIFKRTGIRERRWALEKDAASDLAERAALEAIQRAQIEPGEIDLILISTTSPDFVFPSTSAVLQHRIGARNAAAFDIQASCSGFLYGLSIAEQFLRNPRANHVLVAAAEIKSRMLNFDDPGSAILFGDGAGAVVLSRRKDQSGLLACRLHSDGRFHRLIRMQAGRSRISASSESLRKNLHLLEMDGMPVYRHAVRSFKQAIRELLDSERLSIDDIDLFIFHQANLRLLEKVAADHAIPRRKLATTIEKYGNTSSASIPITLHDAVVNGRIRKGSRTLLAAVGGGLTWASALYQW